MTTLCKRMSFFERLSYTIQHYGGLFGGDDWDEHVPSGSKSWEDNQSKGE